MGISIKDQQHQRIIGKGFIAALDQSGGSTPAVLTKYGIDPSVYTNAGVINQPKMHGLVHEFRSRMITSKPFKTGQMKGAILFQTTMDSEVKGQPTGDYLWNNCSIVPFVKIDKGLADVKNGVQLLKPMPDLKGDLARAVAARMFGTKMRSVILEDSDLGVSAVVDQQLDVALVISDAGLVAIVEPEVSKDMPPHIKAECDRRVMYKLLEGVERIPDGKQIIVKLNPPEEPELFRPLTQHPKILRVVFMSGGYSLDESCRRLSLNTDVDASYSRVLTDGLTISQSDKEFNAILQDTVDKVYAASVSPTIRYTL
ncbi:MAG: fructose-bisphosphate aldolase class I [Alphaproteobacteria bacterium PRO2]|nr:fructose-bisphosphate aldolase class I [Alphaproteobacteria bacterium PRO2]